MKEQMAILGNNRIEDVRWLCSLTESELDLLIGLKVLIQQRAKKIGHKSLANKFDLKTLRALSFILMENLNGKLKDLSGTPGTAESSSTLDACNLLNYGLDKTFANMGVEQLSSYICNDKRKRIMEMFFEDMSPNRKQRVNSDNSRSM
ncbi:uncharacterized protein LOC129870306 [Solanum dulcamara]|uniref:uncharacterized protein LOC129870306 n=1 Tax=Solanum dulcamara TaxID=45834 RepID=UPI0024853950|nr:uncharacterized protein LOC129870306 [Solanum dulcamara]XP_055801015.1 uncharacterized protein LOC129870306 [Solanum dulcamara]XP_055801016.1 uncharacterized protein LOC129870306 [Solanum dulcamara]